jgi:hypothetical protein
MKTSEEAVGRAGSTVIFQIRVLNEQYLITIGFLIFTTKTPRRHEAHKDV